MITEHNYSDSIHSIGGSPGSSRNDDLMGSPPRVFPLEDTVLGTIVAGVPVTGMQLFCYNDCAKMLCVLYVYNIRLVLYKKTISNS